jgi:addiction module HigA family antidote
MAPVAIHPGKHLAEELRAPNMSAAELARRIKVPTNRVTLILNGERAITADTALRLAHFFGTSAEFWLNLQSLYELCVAEAKTGKMIKQLPTRKRMERKHARAETSDAEPATHGPRLSASRKVPSEQSPFD